MRFVGAVIVVLLSTLWSISPVEARWKIRLFKRNVVTVAPQHVASKPPVTSTATSNPAHLVRLLAANSTTFPALKLGMVRIFRGTYRPTVTQVSLGLRKLLAANPSCKLPRGDEHFLNFIEARRHAKGTGHPDAVSATRSMKAAMCKILGYGSHVIAYDIPVKVFERLPPGDPCLAEVVVKHSIPDHYAVGIIRRELLH